MCAMGSTSSNTELNPSSEDTDESEYFSMDSDMDDSYISSDAAFSNKTIIKSLDSQDINTIDNLLDTNEKVSLIYLLYDNPFTALQRITSLLCDGNLKILHDWYHYEKKNIEWGKKLLEALTIIQNYKILKKIGFKKNDLIISFQPVHDISLSIDLIRKCCYRICEDFDSSTTMKFLDYIEKDFKVKNKKYLPKDDSSYNHEYLEMYFLYLETEKYIQNLPKIFKLMNLDNMHDKFENIYDKSVCRLQQRKMKVGDINIDKTPGIRKYDISNENALIENNNSKNVSDIYSIDPDNPGILLIINNEYFYTEHREDLQALLPDTELKLEFREGSLLDKHKLIETFTKLGFKIICKDNIIHDEMLERIKEVVENFQYSSLFVAIMSHGDQGIVYGANSIRIEVSDIQKLMCQKHLGNIPKVLLLQSCQGNQCQKIIDDDDYEVDGPSKKYTPPKTTNLLTFRATIPGFGAVRHRKDGTWFVQTLCKVMENYPDEHFQEICTKVIAEVSGMVWNKNKCMVPLVESTFTKRLYYKMRK